MAIKDKATYGEHYWAMQVEAQAAFDEELEDAFAPYFRGLFSDLPDIVELPAGMRTFISALAEPPSPGFGGFALGVGVEMIDETLHTLMNPAMKMLQRTINKRAKETWLTSEQANRLFRRGKIDKPLWDLTVASEGYETVLSKFLYESQVAYPSIPDLILYSRYHGDPKNVWSTLQQFYDVDARDFKLWEWLGLQRLTTLQAHTLLRRGIITNENYVKIMSEIGWSPDDTDLVYDATWTVPNAMLLIQGNLLKQAGQDRILADISKADIHPDFAQTYLDAVLTKPSTADLVAYGLRQDPKLPGLETDLRKIGIHPDYTDVYKTLAYQIPPVADIITMAVREAFTPSIAARFGQYEDFPPAFAEWAAKKGLTQEWSERYWAAHWSLPSATQGFEMLHRGIVGQAELNMLLRALDIMPFWRDKLTKMAYRRLTRIDIRRMYRVGVLDEAGVYEANLELGYNERDSRRMTEFTVKQTLATQSKFTSRDIISAYTKRMINRTDARGLLLDVGVKSENVEYVLRTADYKRAWEFTEARISGIRNLYKKRVYDDNKARSELGRLNLPAEQADVLMQQWFYEVKEEPVRTWTTAQTLGFIKAELIEKERGLAELHRIGYDAEHIDVFMRSIG